MKKLINRPEDVVEEMLQGLLVLHPGLVRLSGHKVLMRSDASAVCQKQIGLISGGGSGHEPAHAGFIGKSMLTAAVAGEVFTSPSTDSVLAAIRAVAGEAGVLLIVKNYTGDRLNFGLAAEIARAEGITVEQVIVADDVALAGIGDTAGRRGLAGTVLVHKIAGAAAEEGRSLAEVKSIAEQVLQNIGTMSVSLSAGTPPAVGRPSFILTDEEVEIGLGIHGEPGIRRMPLVPADQIADQLLDPVISALQLRRGERVVVLINNLGTTTPMEQAVVARRVVFSLQAKELTIDRLYAGTFMSSLDMAGISISLLRLDDRILQRLDAPTSAPAWPNVLRQPPPGDLTERVLKAKTIETSIASTAGAKDISGAMAQAIIAACDAITAAENHLTELDRVVGDGDLGFNMARAAVAIKGHLRSYPLDSSAGTLKAIALTLATVLGGSSGPLYSTILLRVGTALQSAPDHSLDTWAKALLSGCDAVSQLGGAREGDRTMLDAILPFVHVFQHQVTSGASLQSSLMAGAEAAERGAEATSTMIARRGRSSYLGERALGHPDPGAIAAGIWLRAVAISLIG